MHTQLSSCIAPHALAYARVVQLGLGGVSLLQCASGLQQALHKEVCCAAVSVEAVGAKRCQILQILQVVVYHLCGHVRGQLVATGLGQQICQLRVLVVVRHTVARQHGLALFEHLARLVVVALSQQVVGQHEEHAAVCLAHAAGGLVHVDAAVCHVAVLKACHHVLVHEVAVNHAHLSVVERCDAVGKAFEHTVVVESGIVARAECHAHVHGALPVGVCQHFIYHHLIAVQAALLLLSILERDNHLVGDRVLAHGQIHAAFNHGLLVHTHNYRVGGEVATFGLLHVVVEYVRQLVGVNLRVLLL